MELSLGYISPKDNGMITKWVWKLLILARGNRRGVQGNPQVLSELEASLDYLKIVSPKKKGRKKRNNKNV